MRNVFLGSLLILAVAGSGCKKIKEATTFPFNIPYESTIDLTAVPGLPATDSTLPLPQPQAVNLPGFSFATNSTATYSQNNTSSDKIVSAKLTELSLAVSQPPGGTLDFLNEIRVYMAADGVPEALVAQKASVPKGATRIDLDVQDVELKPLLQRENIQVRVAATFNAVPSSKTQLKMASNFRLLASTLE